MNPISLQTNCTFRIDFAYNGTDYHSTYDGFAVAAANDNYRVSLARWVSGNTPRDDLEAGVVGCCITVNHQPFSTADADHDSGGGNCAAGRGSGGWWWNDCGLANPNGDWGGTSVRGMYWYYVTGNAHSVTYTELKVQVPPGVDWTKLDTRPISPGECS